jgi:protein phosphatase
MRISLYPPLSINEIGQRSNQEDSIIQWNNRLFVLCDGMGGHEKGEVASQTVCQSLVKWFEEHIKDNSFSDDKLREALEYAYAELDRFDDGNPRKMGTTLTLLYIYNKSITAAHMGDSRIYHIRPSKHDEGILYQSRDHSLVFDLFQAGEISYDEMATFSQKNIVTRAMTPGEDNRMRPDIIHITDVQPGDYFYLCSDGMLEQMSNDELISVLISDTTDEEKKKKLIETTVNNQDNHSAWLIHIENVVKEEGDEALENEESTSRCNAINIIPKVIEASEDDVVIVQEVKKTKTLLQRMKDVVDFIMNSKK